MVTLTNEKRTAIAEKLASIKKIQYLIIADEQQFLQECNNSKIREYLEKMLEDDRKNLGFIESAIAQYGIQSEPQEKVQKMVQQAEEMIKGSDFTIYEKVAQHELLKHGQVMCGLIVHKAAQVLGADVQEALAPLNVVNFENRAHQEQLQGILESLGTLELTGEEADQGLWGRMQDTISALTGAVGSVTTQVSHQRVLKIQDEILLAHQQVNTLIIKIENSSDPQKIQAYFGQLYRELIVHAVAEEQVVYPRVRPFYGERDTQQLYDKQAQLKEVLEKMKRVEPNAKEFKNILQRAKEMISDRIRQEETTMFAAINYHCSDKQQQQIATDFQEVKKQLQLEMVG